MLSYKTSLLSHLSLFANEKSIFKTINCVIIKQPIVFVFAAINFRSQGAGEWNGTRVELKLIEKSFLLRTFCCCRSQRWHAAALEVCMGMLWE